MQLSDLNKAVVAATNDMNTQDAYVQALGARVQNGEKTIKVFSENVWTEVKLLDFWQMQYDKYIAMSGYAGDLSGLLVNLQAILDAQLATIPLPEDRAKPAPVAASE